jgi:hypothetical protein
MTNTSLPSSQCHHFDRNATRLGNTGQPANTTWHLNWHPNWIQPWSTNLAPELAAKMDQMGIMGNLGTVVARLLGWALRQPNLSELFDHPDDSSLMRLGGDVQKKGCVAYFLRHYRQAPFPQKWLDVIRAQSDELATWQPGELIVRDNFDMADQPYIVYVDMEVMILMACKQRQSTDWLVKYRLRWQAVQGAPPFPCLPSC